MTDEERDLLGEVAEHLRAFVLARRKPFKKIAVPTAEDLRREGVRQLRALAAQGHFETDDATLAKAARAEALLGRIERGEVAVMTPNEWDLFVGAEGADE